MMGGGGKKFDNITFKGFFVPGTVNHDGTAFTNENGTYTITGNSGKILTVQGVPTNGNNATLQISNTDGESVEDFSITEVGANASG